MQTTGCIESLSVLLRDLYRTDIVELWSRRKLHIARVGRHLRAWAAACCLTYLMPPLIVFLHSEACASDLYPIFPYPNESRPAVDNHRQTSIKVPLPLKVGAAGHMIGCRA